jgi:pimeloyl-ACP methyl ester carboxylesterase
MAERLAGHGYPVLRIDHSGIGDSQTREDRLPFDESAVAEVQDAMETLRELIGAERFVVAGICAGAKVAFDAASRDDRVIGSIPINAGLHLHQSVDRETRVEIAHRAQARHYWRIALFSSFSRKNWRKVLNRQLDVGDRLRVMLKNFGKPRRKAPIVDDEPQQRIEALEKKGVRMLHVYSEGDEWLDYFLTTLRSEIKKWSNDTPHQVQVVDGTDHTFTMLWSQERLIDVVCDWANRQPWTP